MTRPSDHGFISVVSDGDWGYSWSVTEVWFNPENRGYYVFEDSGCSCTYEYEDYKGPADLSGPMTFAEAVTGLGSDAKEQAMKWKEAAR